MNMSQTDADLTSLNASEMARQVRGREVSPEQLLQAHLDRIQALDPEIGAFQLVRTEQALIEARELITREDLAVLPLAGVPVAIKDNIDIAGEPTRYGSAATSSRPASDDDELVKRLRDAGCIIIGKTKIPELAIWPFTESKAFGVTRNPCNTERTPGGSSGGSAAAVAAHMAALAIGSDGGGSIRIPAACCGLVGLKPGPGLVPLAGGDSEHWLGMSEYGPLARNVEDLKLMLDVLGRNSNPGYPRPPRPQLRIAISKKSPVIGARVDPQVTEAINKVASLLAAAGHQVQHAEPPYPLNIAFRFMRRWLPGIARDAKGLQPGQLEKRTRSMARAGRWIQRMGWAQAAADDSFGANMARWFSDYDVLLTPTLAEPAVAVGKWRGKGWLMTAFGSGNWVFTSPWNLARFPAASMPAGISEDGLPIGMQLVAAPGGEDTLISLMTELEAFKQAQSL
jgi:amidase